MTISVANAVKKVTAFGGGVNPVATDPITTTTGSTFVVLMQYLDDPATVFGSFSDTIGGSPSGNTWTQFGTTIDSGTGAGDGLRARIYYCQNANGGANHVFTLAFASIGNALTNLFVIEIAGAAAASFDVGVMMALAASSPIATAATATTAQADELVVGFNVGANDSGTGNAHIVLSGSTPAPGSWTVNTEEADSSHFFNGGIASAVVSSVGAFVFSFTCGDASNGWCAIMTFKAAASSGTLKTLLGIADASLKTIEGIAKASVKTVLGLTP
jgi:hypothetical protein